MASKIRLGDRQDTRGTAFVVYDDIYDAKSAVDHLSGFNVCGRYLIVLYYQVRNLEFPPLPSRSLSASCPCGFGNVSSRTGSPNRKGRPV